MIFRYDIINRLVQRTGAKRYLEIGVQGGECFNRIRCDEKVSVDPNVAATYVMTSDTYFARVAGGIAPFDVVFVDGLHHREQVLRDILNAVRFLNPTGAVVVHDCDPPSELAGQREACGGIWCGDVWQGWLDARLHLQCWTGVVDTDLGCGLILPWKRPQPVPHIAEEERTWAKFQATRAEWLGLVGVEELERVLTADEPAEEIPAEDAAPAE